jgi:hypothetical protein
MDLTKLAFKNGDKKRGSKNHKFGFLNVKFLNVADLNFDCLENVPLIDMNYPKITKIKVTLYPASPDFFLMGFT